MSNQNQKIRNCKTLLDNIAVVRNIMNARAFDESLFDSINGQDSALESLCGRQIVFGLLDEAGKTSLRREIMNHLTENEIKTLGKLREYLTDSMENLVKVAIIKPELSANQKEVLDSVGVITERVRNILPSAGLDTSTFTAEGAVEAATVLAKVTDFLNTTYPVLSRILADADDESTAEPQSVPTIDTTEGAEQAPAEEPQPDPPMNDPDHVVYVDPSKEDEAATAAIAKLASSNKSIDISAAKFILADEKCPNTMQSLGYMEVSTLTDTIKMITESNESYLEACKKVFDSFPVTTCVSEELVKANEKIVDAYVAISNLIGEAEGVRAKLLTTRDGLVDALKAMEDASR